VSLQGVLSAERPWRIPQASGGTDWERVLGEAPVGNVVLAGGRSASEMLHDVLAESMAVCGADNSHFGLPASADQFRRTYVDVLPRFEAARLASPMRSDLAGQIVAALQHKLVWQSDNGFAPVADALGVAGVPLPLTVHDFGTSTGWLPALEYRDRVWKAHELAVLGEMLAGQNVITPQAAKALAWVQDHVVRDGRIQLNGRRIAMFGAGAEMAPTQAWLAAGADVLWLDSQPPPVSWSRSGKLAGRLHVPAQPVDLLTRPHEVLATLLAFSNGAPLDLGLYAYAPGQAREMRLTGVMNALVDALPQELVRSVTMLVSPTTPAALSAWDVAAMKARFNQRPRWEALLAATGLLSREDGCTQLAQTDQVAVSRSLVSIQGASYQAAQYIGKVLTAECWYQHAENRKKGTTPVRISANTAAITRTRSVEHPVFTAAFGGAAAFGVQTLVPDQSRHLNGLLAIHDWLHPEAPVPGTIRVHGGIHTLPYPLESALRVASVIGFVRSPQLLRGLLKG